MKNQINISKLFACTALAGAVAIFAPVTTFGVPITFDLRNTTAAVEIESGTIERGGIKASLSPSVVGNIGVLNQTALGFGVDVKDVDGEVSNHLDAGLGTESITISFNVDVTWSALVLSIFSSGEQASLTLGSNPSVTLLDTGSGVDTYSFSADNLVLAGQTVVLRHARGNGFSFDSFTVEQTTSSSPVPDSGTSLALLSLAFGGLGLFVRHRRL